MTHLFDLVAFFAIVAAFAPRLLDRSDRWAQARKRGVLPDRFFERRIR